MMLISLFIFHSLGDDLCNLRLCSITLEKNIIDEIYVNMIDYGYTFWYRYQVLIEGDYDFIIFQEASTSLGIVYFSFQISLKNQVAKHEFYFHNRTDWDDQLIRLISQDQNSWHFFIMYYDSGKLYIKIFTTENTHTGINIGQYFLRAIIHRNIFYPQIRLTICGEQIEYILDLKQLDIAEIQQCKDEIHLEYSPDFKDFLSEQFNSRKAIITVWLKDQSETSSLTITLLSVLTDQHQAPQQASNNIQANILNYTHLTILKFNQTFILQNFDHQNISVLGDLTFDELSQWYFLKLEPNISLELQTVNNIYKIDSSIQITLPNTQIYLKVNDTIFTQLLISKSLIQGCSPNCLLCFDLFTCYQCKGNRISPSCNCPTDTQDFSGLDCEYMHIKLELNQVDIVTTCPMGYEKCSEIVICTQGYARFKNKCYKCPKLGEEISQQCVISPQVNQRFICKYVSDENLQRYMHGQIDDTMFFIQMHLYDDELYQTLKYASVSIIYQVVEDIGFKAVKYEQQSYIGTTKRHLCPYRYDLILDVQSKRSPVCLKIPKNCLRLDFLGSQDSLLCEYCKPTYTLLKNKCIKCPQNCQSCTITQCTSCVNGYYLSYNGICRFCDIKYCQICYEYAQGYLSIKDNLPPYSRKQEPFAYCAICNHGFEFNYQTRQCQSSVQETCEIAIFNQKSICLVGSDSQVITSSCLQQNCNLCFKKQCIRCDEGYYIKNAKCNECKFQYSVNSDQTFILDCYLHDPINYSEYKQSLQHIFVLHFDELYTQSLTQVMLKQCLNGEVLYDIAKCQTRNNLRHEQHTLCNTYILLNGTSYCTEVNQKISGLVIDRLSGKVKHCNESQACDLKKQYNITSNNFSQIQYRDMVFHSFAQFIQSLDIANLKTHSITEIDIHLTLQTQKQQNIIAISEVPLNLYIYLNPEINLNLYAKPEYHITIGYFKNIYMDKVDHFYQSILFNCQHLNIIKYYLFDIHDNTEYINVKSYTVAADTMKIEKLFIIKTSRIAEIQNTQPMVLIIQVLQIQYCNFDDQTKIFQPAKNKTTFIQISEFRILSSSSILSALFGDRFRVVNIKIEQLVLQKYEMRDSNLITARNITIETILIHSCIFYNSTIFNASFIQIRSLKIINSTFVDSRLIHNENLATNLAEYFFESIELNKILSTRSQILDFDGQIFKNNKLVIVNLTIQQPKLGCGFIQIRSLDCQIYNLQIYDTYLSNMTLLNVLSQHIVIDNITISNSKTAFATLNDEQIIVPEDNFASYIMQQNFITLNLSNAYIGQFYVRYPIVKISSIRSKEIFLHQITFDQLQVFSSQIIQISGEIINMNQTFFKNIWFHSLNQDGTQQQILFQCTGQSIFINQLGFWQIRNTNSHYLQWAFLQGNSIKLRKVMLQQFQFDISKYFHEGANHTIINQISSQKGNNQLMNIVTESFILDTILIYTIESSNQFLIRLHYDKVIERLEINTMKLDIITDRQYSGILYSNQQINYVSVYNVTSKQLNVQIAVFYLKVNNFVMLNNITLNLNQGGLLICEALDSTNISFTDINIYQSLKSLNISQLKRVLIDIYGGFITIYNFTVIHCITDVFHLKSFQSVHISQLYITETQAICNLILLESESCLKVKFVDIFIFNHKLQPQDILSKEIYNKRNLIKFQLNLVHQYIMENIVHNNNQDIDTLIILVQSTNFMITRFQIMNNICQSMCLISTNDLHQAQSVRILQIQESNILNLIDGVIIANSGTLISFVIGQVHLQKLLIVHNGMIFNPLTQNTIIWQIEETELIYHSDHIIDINSVIIYNTSIMNEQFQNIQKINKIALTLSFDGGDSQYLTVNDTVIFYKTETRMLKYCYFPTGQSLGEYQRLNFQDYNYETFIKEMKFGLRGRTSQTDLQCVLSYQDKQYPFRMNQQNWKDFTLISEPKSIIYFQVSCPKYTLSFLVKVLDCQLGEIYLNSSCLRCDSNRNQYSVKRDSIQCLTITGDIQQVQSGLIKLKPGFWRPFLTNSHIERCPKQQICLGGWQVGDNSCLPGYLGALCAVCDIYSQRGYGNYVQDSWNQCELCQTRFSIILYICIILLIQVVLLFFNHKSWQRDCLQLRNITLLCKHYRILVKYYVDHTQVAIKLFTNFLQQFLVITSTYQLGLPIFLKQFFYQYSNPSISIWQEIQCFYANQVSLAFLIQAKPLIIIVVSMVVLNIYLFIHLNLIKKKMWNYLFRNLCVTFYYHIIFNYTNYYEILIALASWRRISGLRWVNTNISISYDKQEYIENLFIFVLPQIALFWVMPLIVLKILNIKQLSLLKLKTYYYWGFLYKQFKLDSYNEEIYLTWIKLTIISIAYQLSNHSLYRQSALLLVIAFYKKLQENHKPYQFQNFNRLNVNLYYGLMGLVVLFSLLSDQINNDNANVTIIIYIFIGLVLLIISKLILKQLLDSIRKTYKNSIDDLKMILSNKLPNLTIFKSSSIRLSQVKANFDKMSPKYLQLSRWRSTITQSQTGTEQSTKSKSIAVSTQAQVRQPDHGGQPVLQLNVAAEQKTSIIT